MCFRSVGYSLKNPYWSKDDMCQYKSNRDCCLIGAIFNYLIDVLIHILYAKPCVRHSEWIFSLMLGSNVILSSGFTVWMYTLFFFSTLYNHEIIFCRWWQTSWCQWTGICLWPFYKPFSESGEIWDNLQCKMFKLLV